MTWQRGTPRCLLFRWKHGWEVVQGSLGLSHRCNGFEPLWVHGALPDNSNGNRIVGQPAGAVPIPPGNDVDAPRDQLDLQPRGLAPPAHPFLPREVSFEP